MEIIKCCITTIIRKVLLKKVILIQARLSSSRFPQKMLKNLGSYTLLEYVYRRCCQSKKAQNVIIVTSIDATDNDLYQLCISKSIPVYRGSLENVFERYLNCSTENCIDIIARVCGDSPFVDIDALDKSFDFFEKQENLEYSFVSNTLNGFMSEVFTVNLLKKLYNLPLDNIHQEHVTKYIRDYIEQFDVQELRLNLKPKYLEHFTLTIDYESDLAIAQKIIEQLDDFSFTSEQVIKILKNIEG